MISMDCQLTPCTLPQSVPSENYSNICFHPSWAWEKSSNREDASTASQPELHIPRAPSVFRRSFRRFSPWRNRQIPEQDGVGHNWPNRRRERYAETKHWFLSEDMVLYAQSLTRSIPRYDFDRGCAIWLSKCSGGSEVSLGAFVAVQDFGIE